MMNYFAKKIKRVKHILNLHSSIKIEKEETEQCEERERERERERGRERNNACNGGLCNSGISNCDVTTPRRDATVAHGR